VRAEVCLGAESVMLATLVQRKLAMLYSRPH